MSLNVIKPQHLFCRHDIRGAVRRTPEAASFADGVYEPAVVGPGENVYEDALPRCCHEGTPRSRH